MAANALTPFVYQLQHGLRSFDLQSWMRSFDLNKFFNEIDLKTVGSLALVIVAVVFLLDLLKKSYSPYGKSLAVSAADAWQSSRQQIRFDEAGRNSRSLEPLTEVLDSLAEAVKKWEEKDSQQDSSFRHRSF